MHQVFDWIGLALAVIFVASVISNAQHLVINSVKDSPNVYSLVIALVLVAYTTIKNKGVVSRIGLLILAVLATSGLTWVFGLRSAQSTALNSFSILLGALPIALVVAAAVYGGSYISKKLK